MERMRECEWFCANCLQMLDALNKHGRCPYCESNAVDVAYRWRLPGEPGRDASHEKRLSRVSDLEIRVNHESMVSAGKLPAGNEPRCMARIVNERLPISFATARRDR